MASVSPPKPWERGGTTLTSNTTASSFPTTSSSAVAASSSSDPPALPQRPSTLSSVVNRTASNYSPLNGNRFSNPGYGGLGTGLGSYSAYSSPYSRLGGYGGSMYGSYGGMGGYGGMYGGMGSMGGMGGMGGYGMGGMQGDPNDPNSLTNSFSQSTQATFQIIESIVGAFGGFAQMLESTYMATHNSFFAMVSVAEQFGNLRNTLGSILGIYTLLRWLRTLLAKVTGQPPPASARELTPANFAQFEGRATLPDGTPAGAPRPSRKPFLVFLLAAFGLPYLMGKLIQTLARNQEEEEQRRRQQAVAQGASIGPNGEIIGAPMDPTKLDFCRVLYEFKADANMPGVDLDVKKDDLVAVLSKTDPVGNPSEWWRCRARDGRVGYLPSPYLEVLQRKNADGSGGGLRAITSGSHSQNGGSRTASLRSQTSSSISSTDGAAAAAAVTAAKQANLRAATGAGLGGTGQGVGPGLGAQREPVAVQGKVGDISAESFQRSQFYQ